MTTYFVTTTADSGAGSLRDAINAANYTPSGITEIDFNIGTQGVSSGMQTISPATPLPALTASGVFINGYSENQWQGVTSTSPLIELYGPGVGSGVFCLLLDGDHDAVWGLFITNFTEGIQGGGCTIGGTAAGAGNVLSGNGSGVGTLGEDLVLGNYIGTNAAGTAAVPNRIGIEDQGPGDTIGGSVPGARNIISGNTLDGELIYNSVFEGTPKGDTIQGNYFGLNYNGSAAIANGNGVEIDGGDVTIGGTAAGAGNVISGNSQNGVQIGGADDNASGTVVQGNLIGTDATGAKAIGNAVGITVSYGGNINQSQGVTIGGSVAGVANVISGNSGDGVDIASGVSGALILGNYIGTNHTGDNPLPNSGSGISIAGNNNTVGAGNTIADNSNGGVLVSAGAGNTITQNFIFANGGSNTGPGITVISGANNNIAAPTLSSASITGYTLTVKGSFTEATANVPYVLEFFANPNSDAEGKVYVGSLTMTPTGTGTPSFTFTTTTTVTGTYPLITATLTDSSGDTSPFSNGVGVISVTPYVVTSTADDGSVGTLRDAINQVNAGKYDAIEFNIAGTGVQTINLASALPALTASGVFIDGQSENQFQGVTSTSPLLSLNGSGAGSTSDGLLLTGSNCIVSGLIIESFGGNGIEVAASNNTIGGPTTGLGNVISGNKKDGLLIDSNISGVVVLGNYIGTNVAGSAALANSIGVEDAGSNNTIGGSGSDNGNLISGNKGDGVLLDSTAAGNVLQGNFVGTDYTGEVVLGNGSSGIEIAGVNNTVGGTATLVGNILAGNSGDGLRLDSSASGTLVQGNGLGMANGGIALGNSGNGVNIAGNNNTVGGTSAAARNTISGNTADGVLIASGASGNLVHGNYIGTDLSGTTADPNNIGILVSSSQNTIGGSVAGAGNVISGNSGYGVDIAASGTTVQGNYIGTDYTGTKALANSIGILVSSSQNTIGGGVGEGNVISGNSGDGVQIASGVSGVLLVGNDIGTDHTGTTAVANGTGVEVSGSDNTVGPPFGTDTTDYWINIISGNTGDGVLIDSGVSGAVVQGNYIGINAGGGALGNSIGVEVAGSSNTVGSLTGGPGPGNLLSGNKGVGVLLDSTGAGNVISSNYVGIGIFSNDVRPNSIGIEVAGNGNTIGGASGSGNVVSGNTGDGVMILSSATGNQVLGNTIGVNVYDSGVVGNSGNGIEVAGSNNTLGASSAVAYNEISGNSGDGVKLDSGGSGNVVLGSYIGTDHTGTKAVANSIGVEVAGNSNTIGSSVYAGRNVISGNTNDGVKIDSGASGNQVLGDRIGINLYDSGALGNSIGIEVAGSNNTLGASWAVAPNEISGNRGDGVKLDAGSSGNQVLGSYIGTNYATTAAVANSVGIEDDGSSNTIGGSVLGAKNVISGNTSDGVLIDPGATNETMQGNYIGTDYSAMVALGNGFNGVEIYGTDNIIGGNSGANYFVRNFISGNGGGVLIRSGASGNQVQGNFIGIDVFGIVRIGNGAGVEIEGSSNTVGGTSSGYMNVISGNSEGGVFVFSSGAGNVIQNNFVGTDYTGRSSVANTGSGIEIAGNNNTVGAGNVISGNSADGVRIDSSASGNLVLGSLIGINLSGAGSNGGNGVNVAGNNNTVGGTASGARNIISGNTKDGVLIAKDGVLLAGGGSGNQVLGNWIGTNSNGTASVANSIGVEVAGNSNTIGGSGGAGNVISGNSGDGLKIDFGGSGNQVLGDTIGVNWYDGAALANSGNGIEVAGSNNTLGASWAVAPNEISGNSGDGVKLDSGSGGNVVLGSYIGTDHTGTIAFANSVGIEDGGHGNLIGGSVLGARNVISGNSGDGVLIDSTAANEGLQGNYIGTDYSASVSLANGSNGVEIQGSVNYIGGQLVNSFIRNDIDGNTKGDGVKIDSGASGNQVLGNFIGVNISGTVGLANSLGVEIGGSNNTIGSPTNLYTNVISGNSGDGVLLDSTGSGNVIESSFVGTDYTGQSALGNSGSGIEIAGNNNTVYAGNVIAYNSNNGVLVGAGSGNMIRQNSIFSNTGLGISLASGANNNIVAPTISTATLSSGTLTVTGSFTATVGDTYALEFFANPSGDGEGKIFLGELPVTAASTTQDFTFTTTNTSQLGTYPDITATLTDNFGVGDTSAFSNGVTVS